MNEEAPAAKRPKIRLACRECRDRKIRCDGGHPTCNACTRKNLGPDRCVYAGPSIEASPDYVRSLETRIRELEYNANSQPRPSPSLFSTPQSLQPLHISSAETLATLRYRPIQSTPSAAAETYSETQAEIRVATVSEVSPARGEETGALIPASEASHGSAATNESTIRGHQPDTRDTGSYPSGLLVHDHLQRPPMNDPRDDSANPHERSTMGVEGLVEDGTGAPDGSSVFLGRSSAAAFMNEVRGKVRKRRRGEEGSRALPASSPASQSSRTLSRRAELDMADLLQQLVLPPRRVADHHLSFYWKYIYPFNPILHRKTFQRRYEEIWSQNGPAISSPALSTPETEDADATRAFYALFNILIALGSLHSTPSRESTSTTAAKATTGDTFFDRAEQLITERTMKHDNILSVQVFILMAHYLQIAGKVNKCWVMVGTAIRTAQGLGIHLSPASESQAQQQERRRTWVLCLQMDRIVGMMFGRPPMVGWSTSDPNPALTDDDLLSMEPFSASQPVPKVDVSFLAFFIHSVRYSEILLEVLKVVYTSPQSHAGASEAGTEEFRLGGYFELLRLDSLLAEWYNQLPPYLVVSADEDFMKESTAMSQVVSMLCRYLHLKMLLFRSVTVEVAKGNVLGSCVGSSNRPPLTELQRSVVLGCVHSCIFAAQDIIKATHTRCVRNPGRLPNWWYPTFYVFTAGTVILAVMLSRHRQALHPTSATPLETIWRQAMETLAVYEDQGRPFARQCAWTLQTALDQGLRDTMSESRRGDSGNEDEAPETGEVSQLLGRGRQPLQQADTLEGSDNLADTILGDDWWQTGGLNWLDNVDVPDDFVTDGHMNLDSLSHAR